MIFVMVIKFLILIFILEYGNHFYYICNNNIPDIFSGVKPHNLEKLLVLYKSGELTLYLSELLHI